MNLQDLLNNSPQLHKFESGELTSWKLSDEVLSFIDKHVDESSNTLETGAGISTILFGLKCTNHICIVPEQDLVDRITEYGSQHKIILNKITFKIAESEKILPFLKFNKLDLVLIDGRHAFPTPFIDWYYTSPILKVGGIMIIDDTHILTGHILRNFLLSEPEWQLQESFSSKTAIFIKLKEYSHSKMWTQQPYLMRSSYLITIAKIHKAFGIFRRGDFSTLIKKLPKNFGS